MDMPQILIEVFKYSPAMAFMAVVAWLQYKQNKADKAAKEKQGERLLEMQKKHSEQVLEIQQESHRLVEEIRDTYDKKREEVRDEYDDMIRNMMEKVANSQMELAASISQHTDKIEGKLEGLTREVKNLQTLTKEQRQLVPQR